MVRPLPTGYFQILFFSIILCFITYGYTLTNFSLSIDSEQPFFTGPFSSLGRWGCQLIRVHIFSGIVPYFTLLLGLVLLSFAAVETSRILRLNSIAAYVFCALFVSFPQLSYQLVFTLQADCIGLGFLSGALVVKYFVQSVHGGITLRNAALFIVSSLLFMFTIAIYQTLIIIPVIIYLIYIFQNTFSEEYSFKTELKKGFLFAALTIISVLLYVISVKITIPAGSGGGEYLSMYTSGDSSNRFSNFMTEFFRNLMGKGYYGEKTYVAATIAAIAIIGSFLYNRKKPWPLRTILIIAITILPYLLSVFISSGTAPPRLFVASGIALAFIVTHFTGMFRNQKIALVLPIFIVLVNIYFITMLFWSHSKIYNHDINIARNIDFSIRNQYPEFDPAANYVYFFGCIPYTEHDRYRIPDSEIFGGSFF
ncbi:glucosyltransferase domain-containing protein, partial [uncultured Flavobacterium sp.]|uniref:glucosyltransferase domain-containing protein n=1 Tax=uncultured Flavobacterium sp. TaxID=165435 RepID=UPI0025F53137